MAPIQYMQGKIVTFTLPQNFDIFGQNMAQTKSEDATIMYIQVKFVPQFSAFRANNMMMKD